MLPQGFQEVEIQDGRFQHGESAAADGIVIIHASRLPEAHRQKALFTASAAANLHLVLISGGHQDAVAAGEHVYAMQRPLPPRQADGEFRACFARFWDHLSRSGEPCFELLEPAGKPLVALALLCQGYLLAQVRPGTTSVDLHGASAEIHEAANQALSRLGLTAGMIRSGAAAGSLDRQASLVREAAWWSPLDAGELQRSLDAAAEEQPALQDLVAALAAGHPVKAECLVPAYLELEAHLRATSH